MIPDDVNCYEAARIALQKLRKEGVVCRVVVGKWRYDDPEYHAWVEGLDWVYDPSMGFRGSRGNIAPGMYEEERRWDVQQLQRIGESR